MLKRIPGPVRITVFLLVLGSCGVQVVRAATATPVTAPRAEDVKKAAREATSRVGGVDVRAPLPAAREQVGGNGVVEPAKPETRVAAQSSAVVLKVEVVDGQRVKAGQVLVRLADAVERAALEVALAELAAERAANARAVGGLRGEEREALAAEAQSARARAELAAGVLARTERLATAGAATVEELDRARRQAQSERAASEAMEARLRAAEAGTRREDLGIAQARVAAAEGRVAQARAALERLTVRSPIDAEVLQVKVREGELYSSQSQEPLLILGDTSRLRVRMDVDETDIARVRLGARAWATADAFGDEKFTGRVTEIGRRFGRKNVRTDDPIEKNDTKVLEVVIELDSNERLVPGQRVTSFISAIEKRS